MNVALALALGFVLGGVVGVFAGFSWCMSVKGDVTRKLLQEARDEIARLKAAS